MDNLAYRNHQDNEWEDNPDTTRWMELGEKTDFSFEAVDREGHPVNFESYFPPEDLTELGNYARGVHVLQMRNEAGKLLAERKSDFEVLEGKVMFLSGVLVRNRGKGHGSLIETGFQKFLQSFANERQQPVVWCMKDMNKYDYDNYLGRPEADQDPDVLEALHNERQRWLALYGPGGKLGIQPVEGLAFMRQKIDGIKEFEPEPLQLEEGDDIEADMAEIRRGLERIQLGGADDMHV